MKKRVLSLFLAITLCLTLTPTGALAEDVQPPEQTVVVTQETEPPTPAPQKEESTAPAENGADENASPASPDEKPTENTPAAAEKNTADGETDKETAAATGRDESKADGSPSDDDAAKVQNQLVMAAAAGPGEPTMMGQNNLLVLADEGQAPANAQNSEGGGIYVPPGGPTEGGGGTYIPGEDTRTEIWCVGKPDSIGRSYDGTMDGGTIPIDLTFTTDGTNEIKFKEGTDFTAVKTFDSADAGNHTVTVEITLIGEAATKYKLRAGEERFEIGGYINKAYPKLTVSLSKTACTAGEKILPLLSISGVQENAAVTYYYTQYKTIAGDSEYEGSDAIPEINDNTVIDKLDEEGNNTYYVYARTAATQNYQEGMSNVLEFTVAEKVDPVASVTSADGTETTYGSFSDAWTAAIANNGSTLKLLADATLPNGNTDLDQSLTLDLNGYVLGSNGSLTVKSGAALTVKNAGGEKSEKPVNVGLYLTLWVEKGGSFTCTDGGIRYLGLQAAGTGNYNIKLAEGESYCAFGGFAQGDESATVDDLLKATPGLALHADDSGSNVQIVRSTLINKGFDYFSFYVGPCSEHKIGEDGACIYCGASYVASVTTSNGVTNNYTSLDDALDAAKDGDTVKLLGDAEITKWRSLTAAITLDLNGKTITTQSKAELYIHAQVIVQDSSTGKTGGMAGTALLNVQEGGDLIIKSGTFNGRITINVGKLTIKGGTFNQEVDLRRGDSDSVFFSGGTFAKIWYPNSSGSFLDLLADGCAFYDNDGKLVNVAEITGTNLYNVRIRPHQHTFTNGACGCGYTCPHTSVDESGACTVCGKQFAASITEGNDVTYYDTFGSALFYATRNDGCTLKLLADVTGTTVVINNPFIFDLNGHSVDALSVDAKATIKDSGTTKGRIGKVTVFNEKVTDLTLGSLLEEGYAFKYENGYWADDSHKETISGLDVTVEKAPIQSVEVYAKDKKNNEVPTNMAYGTTGEVTLVSSCRMGETSGADLTYLWYKLEGAAATAPLEGATGANYTLPDNLAAGTHTYLLICTSGGYSKSAEITITVTPISLEGATVTVKDLTYNGQEQFPTVTVKLGETTLTKNTDFYVDATMQANAGSYTLTVNGNGNYSGKIENVEWKIEPMKIDSVMVSSDISKVYDGTAEINMSANEWATALKFKTLSASDVVDVPSKTYTISDAYFVKKSGEETIYSPDAGEKYGITFKITLNDDNYVLQTYGEDTPSTSKVITQSGGATFTIKQATVTSPGEITQLVFNDLAKTYTIDLAKLLPKLSEGCAYGSIQYQGHNYNFTDNAYLDGNDAVSVSKEGVLTLSTVAASTAKVGDQIGTITVPVVTTNYQNFEFTIKVVISARIPLNASGVTVSASEITYGQTLNESKLTATGTMKHPGTGEEVRGTFAWKNGTVKPDASDSYEAEWTFTPAAGYEEYAPATGTVTIKVNKATPTFTAPTAQENLTYTGQEQALITAGMTDHGTMRYSLTENGTYSQDTPTGTDAGAYTVWYRVIGDANHNDTAPASVAVRIGKKPLTITGVTAASKPYDGTTNADISSVTFDNVTLNRGTDYTVTANFDDASVGNGKNITATVTLMEQAAKNYALEQSSFTTTGSITKAAAPDFAKETALTIVNGHEKTYTVTLPALPTLETPKEYGAPTYELGNIKLNAGYYTSGAKVENDELTLPIQKNDVETTGSVGTVTVVIKSINYENITLTVNVNAVNQPVPVDTITASEITYGNELSASTITGTMQDPVTGAAVNGTITWLTPAVKLNAGSHSAKWIFTPDKSYGGKYTTNTGTATVTVNPKAVTVNITPNGGTYGSVTAAAAKLSGAVEGDNVPVTLTYTGNGYNSTAVPTNAGSYTVTASIADSNYVLTGETTANFVIEPKSIKGAKVVLGKGLIANGAEQTQTVEKVLLDDKEIPAESYTVAGNTATDPGRYTLTVTAKGNYTDSVEQTYVIIPAKAESAPGEEIAIGSGKVKVDVQSEGTVPPAPLLTDKAELLAMLVNSGDITADELVQIANGANVDIVLTVKEANVPDAVKTAMAQAAKDYTIGQYLDISLFKYMTVKGSQQAGVALRTTKNALTISVAVPDALINTNSAVNRTYCIVRRHDGAITVLDAAFDAASKTLTFKTDRFSDYAIAYKDTAVPGSGSNPSSNNSSNDSETKKNEVAAPTPASASTSKPSTITAMPQTGDTSNPTLYVVLLVASLLGLAVVFVCKKRNDK